MKIKCIMILLILSFQIVAQTQQNKTGSKTVNELKVLRPGHNSPDDSKDVKQLKVLNSTYNSSEEQFTSHKNNKSRNQQTKHGTNGTFICESTNYNRNHCFADTEGGIRLVRQMSRRSCINNWGYDYYGVWVINGCRAEFATNRYEDHYGNENEIMRCESYGYIRQLCRVDLRNADVTLIHQLGRISCSNNWGYDESGIWVANGCKADFHINRSTYDGGNNHNESNYIDCFSETRRTETCKLPALSGVEIDQVHNRSPESCRGNWGYSSHGIWVANGFTAVHREILIAL